MATAIPDKLYFKIGEVASLAGVAPHVLRYWESEFPEICPKRANSGQRLYRREDLELILKIRSLLHQEGYTIAGARRLIATARHSSDPGGSRPAMATDTAAKLQQLKQELQEIQGLLVQKRRKGPGGDS